MTASKWMAAGLIIIALILCSVIGCGIAKAIRGESASAPGKHLLNQENAEFGQIVLTLHDFDYPSTTLRASVRFDPGPKLWMSPEYPFAREDLGNISIFMDPLPEPSLVSGDPTEYVEAFYIIDKPPTQLDPTIRTIRGLPAWDYHVDIDIELPGSESAFPFDSHSRHVTFRVEAPDGLLVEGAKYEQHPRGPIPFQFWVIKEFEGYSLDVETTSNISLIATVRQAGVIRLQVIAITVALTLLALWVLLRTLRLPWRSVGDQSMVPSLVGLGAILIAMPTLRLTLVPADIQSETALDWMLLLPLVLAVFAILWGFAFALRGRRPTKKRQAPRGSDRLPLV